jgi:hypothetical protein
MAEKRPTKPLIIMDLFKLDQVPGVSIEIRGVLVGATLDGFDRRQLVPLFAGNLASPARRTL